MLAGKNVFNRYYVVEQSTVKKVANFQISQNLVIFTKCWRRWRHLDENKLCSWWIIAANLIEILAKIDEGIFFQNLKEFSRSLQ